MRNSRLAALFNPFVNSVAAIWLKTYNFKKTMLVPTLEYSFNDFHLTAAFAFQNHSTSIPQCRWWLPSLKPPSYAVTLKKMAFASPFHRNARSLPCQACTVGLPERCSVRCSCRRPYSSKICTRKHLICSRTSRIPITHKVAWLRSSTRLHPFLIFSLASYLLAIWAMYWKHPLAFARKLINCMKASSWTEISCCRKT